MKTTPVELENITYADAKAGNVEFAAVVKNPETSAKPLIRVSLQSDATKRGEKEIVVVEQTLKIVMSEPREVRPLIPTENNNATLVQQRRKAFEVHMTRGGKPVAHHPFRLRTDYVWGSGGHDHGDTPTVVRENNHDNYGYFTAGQSAQRRRPLDDVTGAEGRFDGTYHASIWGDTIRIYLESRNNRLLKDSVSIVERVAGLELLPESPNYLKTGGTCNHRGPRTDNLHQTCRTPDNNHWIDPQALDSLEKAAEEFLNAPWNQRQREKMRINDISLPLGGLFDINGDWQSPHVSHRNGKDVDIENNRLTRLRAVLERRRWTYIPEGPNFFPHFRFE